MTNQSKRGTAAILIASGVVACVGLLIVGRLAPTTFTPSVWIAVFGVILSDLALAFWLMKTSKD